MPLAKVFEAHLVGAATHATELGADAAGNMVRLQNVINALPEDIKNLQTQLAQAEKQLVDAKEELKQPFAQERELADKSARLAELDALLNVGSDAPVIEGEAEEISEEASTVPLEKECEQEL